MSDRMTKEELERWRETTDDDGEPEYIYHKPCECGGEVRAIYGFGQMWSYCTECSAGEAMAARRAVDLRGKR